MSSEINDHTSLLGRNTPVFTDRRKQTDHEILIGLIDRLMTRIDDLERKITEHAASESATVQEAVHSAMNASFPDGDPEGHRRHHEALIKKAEESAQFWKEMRIAVGKWVGLGLLGFLVTAAWAHFLQGPK